MALLPFERQQRSSFPYIVTMGSGRHHRSSLASFGRSLKAGEPSLVAPGDIERRGSISRKGRAAILSFAQEKARGSKARYCVVWSETDCTFISSDGEAVRGRRPPEADTLDPQEYGRANFPLVDIWHVRLPEGCHSPHLCIRRLTSDRVEISSGDQVVLAYFDEPLGEGIPDPTAEMRDGEGMLIPPATFRGAPVTGVRDECILLGPVQPDGEERRVVEPWPDEVWKACEDIAGRRLSRRLLDAVWRAVEPDPTINYVGVLEAA